MSHLHVYLNDHLAGSVAALDLLDHLIGMNQGSDFGQVFAELRAEIAADQAVLQSVLRNAGAEESSPKKAIAWLAEKIARVKLQLLGEIDAAGLHEALEGLSLGIMGKRALWRSLAAAASASRTLQGPDYEQLESRAMEQFEKVDALSLTIAPSALTGT